MTNSGGTGGRSQHLSNIVTEGWLKAFVGVTDNDWFFFLSGLPGIDEVNFWQPSGGTSFRALDTGEPFLFKLHSPDDYIVGDGLFAHSTVLPVSLAWEEFENGGDYYAMHGRLLHLPAQEKLRPASEFITWHNENVFKRSF